MFTVIIEEKTSGRSFVEGEFETREEAEAFLKEKEAYYNTPIVLRELFGSYDVTLEGKVEEIHEDAAFG